MIKQFEINEVKLKELAKPILNDGMFTIYIADYFDDFSFGNTYIVLRSRYGIKVEFISDNREDQIYCNIVCEGKATYELEDFFEVFNIPLEVEREDFLKMVKEYSIVICENKDKIFQLFDDQHKEETIKRMSKFYNDRLKVNQ